MVRVLVTGAGGFIGRRLIEALLAAKTLRLAEESSTIEEITLVDRYPMGDPPSGDVAIKRLVGDLSDPSFLGRVSDMKPDAVFHLAAGLTLDCERDPAGSFIANVETARSLMESARGTPKFVFASSLAVFGGDLPETVSDDQVLNPGTTYGVHKVIVEQLIADYSRHGRIDGRSLRLPIVVTRPRAAGAAPSVSDLVAAMIREPLDGEDVAAPLSAEARFPVASAGAVVRALIALHDVSASDLPARRAMNFPALTLSGSQIGNALPTFRNIRKLGTVKFEPDEALARIVEGWPTVLVSSSAERLGIRGDIGVEDVITDYLSNRADVRKS